MTTSGGPGDLRSGNEPLHFAEVPFSDSLGSATLLDFWRWAFSNLRDDRIRGSFAEFMVARLLGETDHPPPSTTVVDIECKDGIGIEVKSSAYLQTWKEQESHPSFGGLKRKPYEYDVAGRVSYGPAGYHSEIYILALLSEREHQRLDPLDLNQWAFFVLTQQELREAAKDGSSVSLGRLQQNSIQPCNARELKDSVTAATRRISPARPRLPLTPAPLTSSKRYPCPVCSPRDD